jgi:energy-coupling factor transport system substrate-specific component
MKNQVPNKKSIVRLRINDIVLIALMVATLEAVKIALAFLPNVELVTLMTVLFTRHFKRKIIYVIPVFVLLEYLQWGFGPWTIMYCYIWPFLAIIAYIFRKNSSPLFWAITTGIYGLIFGMLCSIVYIFTDSFSMAVSWWISGIPFDLIHCASNFIIALILFKPLDKVFSRKSELILNKN